MQNRWAVPKDPDVYYKVLKAQQYLGEKTTSKTILYMIRYAYERLFPNETE